MSLRLRLAVAFFILSVVPLGAVTLYTYRSNAAAMRDAARREAELLTGELTQRMRLVTAQLSQQFVRLMDIPDATAERIVSPAVSRGTAVPADAPGATATAPAATMPTLPDDEAMRVAEQLGEVAMLLNSIEVRDFGRGRGRFGGPGSPNRTRPGPFGPGADPERAGERPPRRGDAGGGPPPRPDASDDPVDPRVAGPPPGPPGSAGREPPPADPGRIQIDLQPVRRDILQQIFPDRERWDQLSPQERDLILAKVNERMLGIEQGIRLLQQRASERAADAQALATEIADQNQSVSGNSSPAAQGPLPETPASPAPPPAQTSRPDPAPSAPPAGNTPSREPAASGDAPSPDATSRATATTGTLERSTALSGNRMDVRVTQNGELLGQVNAEINLPSLLATVFTTTRRDQGEVPFAVDGSGRIYTPTEDDRQIIAAIDTVASKPEVPPGTALLPDWVVVTAAGPPGSEIKFGIARPLGQALGDLRRASVRDAALGLGFIGLALIGILPLSSRLTRNLSVLSDGVDRIARGDYRARVRVNSRDEVGRLAEAFNRMAADVERHQRDAVEQERLRRELELGRQIQHDMLPQAPLRLGLTEVRGVSVPATEVGGDFFNYFQTPAGHIALIVGDVSGKGVGAALLMANLQASLRTRLSMGQDLASLANQVDAEVGASTPGAVYATMFAGLLDPHGRTLEYVNAGHNPQFVLRAGGGLERMDATGLPVGLLVGRGYEARRLQLGPGDALFFYTDGCVEVENAAGDSFGSDRLEALLTARSAPDDDLLARARRAIAEFRDGHDPFDDATMMVAKVG